MGLFGKIKNILFEDDDEDEVSEMPTYTKEDIVESPKRAEVEVEHTHVVEEPIKTSDNSYFTNVKRDIDLTYDEKDVLGEIPGAREMISEKKVEEVPVQLPKQEEKKSVFLSFDEEEFERLNSRIVKNENRVRKETQQINNVNVVNDARRANSNFSATSTSRDVRVDNSDRYKANVGVGASPKKSFTPSPIISPVYGILDKNYTKDDIVDKKGGMKREKVVKPVVKPLPPKEENITIEQAEAAIVEVNIDSVRKKAYGGLEELEKDLLKKDKISVSEKLKNEEVIEVPELKKEESVKVDNTVVEKTSIVKEEKIELPSIEDQLDEKFIVTDIEVEEKVELDKVVEDVIERTPEQKKETPVKSNPKMLDDLEKTSTLQILDDIEKELNSIKPISKDISVIEDDDDMIPHSNNTDTLEKDLFNLIDSMYVEGEEEEDD